MKMAAYLIVSLTASCASFPVCPEVSVRVCPVQVAK